MDMTDDAKLAAASGASGKIIQGVLLAALAGMLWGLVFVSPVVLPDYPAVLLAAGRYLAFGLVTLPLAWLDRRALGRLDASDWWQALKLAAVGNLLYYACLAAAIQHAGAPLPTMIIGALPVVIALVANWRTPASQDRVAWSRLALPLGSIATGIVAVHIAELRDAALQDPDRQGTGLPAIVLAIGALACWTWYPIRNSQWMLGHRQHAARTWATAQGLATLPLALITYLGMWPVLAHQSGYPMPLGPRPALFVGVMLAVGLLASWVGTMLWNAASQRLPTTLMGAMIVFETLAALGYAYLLRGAWPDGWAWSGIGLLIIGVIGSVRVTPMADAPAHSATRPGPTPACAESPPVPCSVHPASPRVPEPPGDRR